MERPGDRCGMADAGMTEADLTLSDKDKVWSGISEYVKNRK